MKFEFNKLYLLPLAVALLIIGGYYLFSTQTSYSKPGNPDEWQVFDNAADDIEIVAPQEDGPLEQQITEAPKNIMIYITGEVENPGVYELPDDSRAIDAVNIAGGTTSDAALDTVNLSLRIFDEDHIIIPKIGEEVAGAIISGTGRHDNGGGRDAPTAGTASGLVNINTASSAELQTLRGVGPVTAGRIIEYREKNGAFGSKSDLKKISGIGEKTFESLADYITVER